MSHLYYIRQCLGTPEFKDKMVYRYYIGANSTGVAGMVGYNIRQFKHQIKFFTTKPKALAVIANLNGKEWEVAIYKPRATPGLASISEPYTARTRQIHGLLNMVVPLLESNGKKVAAIIVKDAILDILKERKERYGKQKAALLKEIENGRPN